MAKEFNVALNDLIESYRSSGEPGIRYAIAQEMRTQAELINKAEPWPAEEKAAEAARKAGATPTAEPVEAEAEEEDNGKKAKAKK